MSEAFIVDMMNSNDELLCVIASHLLAESTSLLQIVKKLTSSSEFADNDTYNTCVAIFIA